MNLLRNDNVFVPAQDGQQKETASEVMWQIVPVCRQDNQQHVFLLSPDGKKLLYVSFRSNKKNTFKMKTLALSSAILKSLTSQQQANQPCSSLKLRRRKKYAVFKIEVQGKEP